jgi:hypothetical protein
MLKGTGVLDEGVKIRADAGTPELFVDDVTGGHSSALLVFKLLKLELFSDQPKQLEQNQG